MTTTQDMTREERDAAMVARSAAGETLDSIGQSFGITRERVRQIIAKVGGASAEESRQKRLAAREEVLQAVRAQFLDAYGQLARQMAAQGVTRAEAVLKLRALYPDIEPEVAEDALKYSEITFDKSQVDDIFSKEAITAGIWYLLGSDLGLTPDKQWAAVHLELALIEELREALESAEATPTDIATILGVIGAAQKLVSEQTEYPKSSITGKRYEELRDELVMALGLVSRQGAFPWPPTRQTVSKRFGSWNDSLAAMGIGISALGRPRGLLKFTTEDYANAVRDFCTYAASCGVKSTFAGYDEWVRFEIGSGRTRPSGASVRNVYGTWLDAVRSVQIL